MNILKNAYEFIQNQLDNGGIVNIPQGNYIIDKTLTIKSDTVLNLEGCILTRNKKVPVFGINSGSENIIVRGGTIVGISDSLAENSYGNTSHVFKSKNILFDNVTFKDTCGTHAIDIIGSERVTIRNCNFLGHILNPDGLTKEAIQIDFASYATAPILNKTNKEYDLSHCKDIIITGCKFGPSERYTAQLNAIGTHTASYSSKKHENIIITNNIAEGNGKNGSYGIFVHAINFKNCIIKDNIVKNYARFVRIYSNTTEYKPDGTTISNGENSYCSDIQVSNNIVKCCNGFRSVGVYAVSGNNSVHQNIIISDNIFNTGALPYDSNNYITDLNRCDGCFVNNNYVDNIFNNAIENMFRFNDCQSYKSADNFAFRQ